MSKNPKQALTNQVAFSVSDSVFDELERLHRQTFKAEAPNVALAVTARICFTTGLAKIGSDAARAAKKPKTTAAA